MRRYFSGRRESIALCSPCAAQAQCGLPGHSFDACVSPMEAAGETFCFARPYKHLLAPGRRHNVSDARELVVVAPTGGSV